jgi:hypothetical protein
MNWYMERREAQEIQVLSFKITQSLKDIWLEMYFKQTGCLQKNRSKNVCWILEKYNIPNWIYKRNPEKLKECKKNFKTRFLIYKRQSSLWKRTKWGSKKKFMKIVKKIQKFSKNFYNRQLFAFSCPNKLINWMSK